MKRLFTLSLAFIFLLNTLGISVAMAYCPMKKDYSFSFSDNHSCCCKKADKGNCCKSKKFVLKKIEDRYVSSASQITPEHVESIAYEYPALVQFTFYPARNHSDFNRDHAPPERSVPLNILYSTFRI